MSKSKDDSVAKQVLDYLDSQNRPYSAIDIFNNLHKEHGKTAIVRALESLAQDGKIKEKTYGKQKVYFSDQSQHSNLQDSDLQQMDAKLNDLSSNLSEVQQKIKNSETQLATLTKSLTTKDARSQLKCIEEQISIIKARLLTLQSNTNVISPEEKNAIHSANAKYNKEWRKRKRLAGDIIDAILEGYPKGKKALVEELGIETDEDAKVSLPPS